MWYKCNNTIKNKFYDEYKSKAIMLYIYHYLLIYFLL